MKPVALFHPASAHLTTGEPLVGSFDREVLLHFGCLAGLEKPVAGPVVLSPALAAVGVADPAGLAVIPAVSADPAFAGPVVVVVDSGAVDPASVGPLAAVSADLLFADLAAADPFGLVEVAVVVSPLPSSTTRPCR